MRFITIDTVISFIGLIITILALDTRTLPFSRNIKCVVLVILGICFIYSLIRSNAKRKRLNNGHEKLLELHNKINQLDLSNISDVECNKKLIQFCSKLSDAFSKTKGVQISVCIKYINAIDGTEYIETLSRDVLSMNDKKREYSFNDDKLNDNSDFKNLLFLHNKNGKQWSQIYFLRNNLPNSFGYYNSHLDEAKLHNGIIGIVQRHIKWPLPYKSTLIVPISNPIHDSLYGFLCLDSPSIHVFNKAADLQMLRSISSNSKVCELVNIPILKNQNTKF